MKDVRAFEKFRIHKNREEIIRESVLQVNDIYTVKTMIDIPQSLINAYVKKVKDSTGKNLRTFFGDVDIAEEIIKYVTLNFVNIDQIPGEALMGGAQGQAQDTQGQAQVQQPAQAQLEPQAQVQVQTEAPQGQVQVQTEAPQGQVQVQTEVQPQGQVQDEFQDEFQEPLQDQEEEEDEEEELPI